MTRSAARAPHLGGEDKPDERVTVGIDEAAATPILREYRVVKAQHENHIVLGRMGDFYEIIGTDAEIAAPILGVTLTSRNFGKAGRMPMCGVPHHAAPAYIRRLLDAGHSVAMWDQVGQVVSGKLVRREVTRVLTPGTRMNSDFIDEATSARCCAVNQVENRVGIAVLDASTGELEYLEVVTERDRLADHLLEVCTRMEAVEVVIPQDSELREVVPRDIHTSRVPRAYFDVRRARERIHAVMPFTDAFDQPSDVAAGAIGALLAYASDLQLKLSPEFLRVRAAQVSDVMQLDAATIRNLELIKPMNADGTPVVTILDRTCTPMGGRLLRRYLVEPLTNAEMIRRRLDATTALSDDMIRIRLRQHLQSVRDLERLLARCVQGIASPRDLGAIRDALVAVPAVRSAIPDESSELLNDYAVNLTPPDALVSRLQQILVDEPPPTARDGGAIRSGVDAELDELHNSSSGSRAYISSLEQSEREKTGIRSLKVGYNRVFGYYIEVPANQATSAPEHYIRKQTLANGERYVTAGLKDHETTVLSSHDRVVAREQELLRECIAAVCDQSRTLTAIASAIAAIDVAQSFAEIADIEGWVRPEIDTSDVLDIEGGRHPLVERGLGAGKFVANDCTLDAVERIVILTGPNMAGKSTYLRQVALIALLGQIGGYVPAKRARLGVCDRVFTRVGAHDDLARGISTFMLEMSETANILRHATRRSLVVLDEIGRGTSTYDGLSIAQALVEYLHDAPQFNCRTLFATHYHELTALADTLPRVRNARVDVLEDGSDITFLHRIVAGGADRSYGIHVAKLAGVPAGVLQRARILLAELESDRPLSRGDRPDQLDLGIETPMSHPIIEELAQLDLNNVTPVEALNKLAELQEQVV